MAPDNPKESQLAIERLIEDKQFYDQTVKSGLMRSADFSWKSYFEQLEKVYQTLV